jgi:quinoprotein glucose dehydrogenase
MTEQESGLQRRAPLFYPALLLLVGLVLLGGGIRLCYLGGSSYYIFAGSLLLASSIQLLRGRSSGVRLLALMLLVTIIWALWEVGLDRWGLMPRVLAPVIFSCWLLMPWARRPLAGKPDRLLSMAIAAAVVVMLLGWWQGRDQLTGGSAATVAQSVGPADDWPVFAGDPGALHHTSLQQITPTNVNKLAVAWTFEMVETSPTRKAGTVTVTPIKVGDSLYLCNERNVIYALDAETGKLRWRFDPHTNLDGIKPSYTCRGVAYYHIAAADADCAERIITNTIDARLIALDARSGRPCVGFGTAGVVDLKHGLGDPTGYYVSAAPTVSKGMIIVGGVVPSNGSTSEPSGVVRAYDAVTGRFVWAWDLGRPGDYREPVKPKTYARATPNAWGPMAVDEGLGLVYVPTGNPTPDYWGGARTAEMEKYADSLVALDIATGQPRWHFQTTHHDLWDYDVASQPTLTDWPTAHGSVPAVIQGTKVGEIFVFDRRTGRPLTRVVERKMPGGPISGDWTAPTQPFSPDLPSFAGHAPSERRMWGLTPIDQLWCRLQFKEARYDGTRTPPGLQATVQWPGMAGGINWGGIAVDPARGIMVVNSIDLINYNRLYPRAEIGTSLPQGFVPMKGTPFVAKVGPFLSPIGLPCQQPPYGMISAIDMTTRKLLWSRPLGTSRDTGPLGLRSGLPLPTGSVNMGGALTTASGLIFIGATQDSALRAFDVANGKLLWQARLDAGAQATPMSFRTRSGRQLVVIAAGGHPFIGTVAGNKIVAFALPNEG